MIFLSSMLINLSPYFTTASNFVLHIHHDLTISNDLASSDSTAPTKWMTHLFLLTL